jgi:hypothetical protein
MSSVRQSCSEWVPTPGRTVLYGACFGDAHKEDRTVRARLSTYAGGRPDAPMCKS